MSDDKYTALWVSHSSISDFLKCPRSYYLKNIYRNPKTNRKIQLMAPSLALGQIVHEIVESLSILPQKERFNQSILEKFNKKWEKVTGIKGGFYNPKTEKAFKERGEEMLRRVIKNPGPLKNLAVKIKEELPYYWLDKDENIILCGKIDWLEYLPNDSVHIIDFKTSKNKEKDDSLQLPIYHLLATNCQKHPVSKASYWYLELSDNVEEKKLPDLKKAHEDILKIAKEIHLAKKLNRFKCIDEDNCRYCKPFLRIIDGDAEFIGIDSMRRELYVLKDLETRSDESTIL